MKRNAENTLVPAGQLVTTVASPVLGTMMGDRSLRVVV
jgi:hypothetical protein